MHTLPSKAFFTATGPGKTKPVDVAKFVSEVPEVRKEIGVDEKEPTGEYTYRFLRPTDENEEKEE